MAKCPFCKENIGSLILQLHNCIVNKTIQLADGALKAVSIDIENKKEDIYDLPVENKYTCPKCGIKLFDYYEYEEAKDFLNGCQ